MKERDDAKNARAQKKERMGQVSFFVAAVKCAATAYIDAPCVCKTEFTVVNGWVAISTYISKIRRARERKKNHPILPRLSLLLLLRERERTFRGLLLRLGIFSGGGGALWECGDRRRLRTLAYWSWEMGCRVYRGDKPFIEYIGNVEVSFYGEFSYWVPILEGISVIRGILFGVNSC